MGKKDSITTAFHRWPGRDWKDFDTKILAYSVKEVDSPSILATCTLYTDYEDFADTSRVFKRGAPPPPGEEYKNGNKPRSGLGYKFSRGIKGKVIHVN